MGVWTHPDIRRRSAATKQQWGTSLTAFEHLRNVACNTQLSSAVLYGVTLHGFGDASALRSEAFPVLRTHRLDRAWSRMGRARRQCTPSVVVEVLQDASCLATRCGVHP